MGEADGFERIAIVNRGEPAMRLINAVAEDNLVQGNDVKTVALYTEPDRRAMFVRQADEVYDLGPPTFTDDLGNRQISYLDYSRLQDALLATGADAVWVGWGFVAEHADFAALCESMGITFIGPSAEVMRRLGDKITAKRVAQSSDVPVARWSEGLVDSVEEARAQAARIGYPLLIKATAGGGGRGIRRVDSLAELERAFASARAEALNAFGNETVFLETLVPFARHIEVQIMGDSAGTVWPVGVRDCSVQRRNQKILEEAPSPVLTPSQDRAVRRAAARLGAAAGYQNAGTVEFLFDPDSGRFWFMEVNTRLQVEHPVTELTTGLDLVRLQLHVARGGLLVGEPPATVGHAIEARVNAEDPDAGFTPAPGRIELLRLPTGSGLRVDTGVEEGDDVAAEFDSMIAKVIAFGADRAEAMARLRRGLSQTEIVIRNGTSNKAFLQLLLAEPEVSAATADVGWVDKMFAAGREPAMLHAEVAIVAAAIAAHHEQLVIEIRRFRNSALRGRPEVDVEIGRSVNLRYRGEGYATTVYRLAADLYRVDVDGRSIRLRRADLGQFGSRLEIEGESYRILSSVHGVTHLVEVDGHVHRITNDEGGIVRSPAPAVVVSIDVQPGDQVRSGDRLAVLEAMKMETAIEADFSGVVQEVLVTANAQVGAGTAMVLIDPTENDASRRGERVTFDRLTGSRDTSHERCRHYMDSVHQMLLGYDVEPQAVRAAAVGDLAPCADSLDGGTAARREEEILEIFADMVALFRREPDPSHDLEAIARRTTEEYLFDYLRRPESRGQELPDHFVTQLQRALTHFGIDSLEPTEGLYVALFQIVVSQHRMQEQLPAVLDVLESRMDHPSASGDTALRLLLDRVIGESRNRYPAVHDLAHELSYRVFDQPFLDEVRRRAFSDAEDYLAALADDPPEEERRRLVTALVNCSQPLKTVLSNRFAEASPTMRRSMVEVMTRRYYRIRDLEGLQVAEADGLWFSSAEYDHIDSRIVLIGTHVAYDELPDAIQTLRPVIETVDPGKEVVVDVYVWRLGAATDTDRTSDEVEAWLSAALGDLRLRRIVVAISQPGSGVGMSGVTHFTYRPTGDGGYREESLHRNLHPMMSKRLQLWRLGEFEKEQVQTAEDIYIFRAHALENPADERLFALAEVRDLTPIRDEAGKLVRLPEAERVIQEVLGVIRRFQAHRPTHKRLQSNRVILYLWPVLDMTGDELDHLVERLGPETEGLGLHKVEVLAGIRDRDGQVRQRVLEASGTVDGDVQIQVRNPPTRPIRPLGSYEQKVVRLRQRGLTYPYELVRMLTPEASSHGIPPGTFTEYDLDGEQLVPVDRPHGLNTANVVVGEIASVTDRYPEGMRRIIILGDPSRGMGNLAEAECRRIIAGIDLADDRGVPLEWFAVSAGALIAMDSGTENMDWIARVLRRIIEFTQRGGEINVVVTGINVGAQPYWNAEATMLMHTRGILVMMPESAMVLTGKDALDFSGGVSAEDNIGIGGHERIMGPNGQAQYFARDLHGACRLLLQYYAYTYVSPGETLARRASTDDPVDRDVRGSPHGGLFTTVGEVFDEETNPGRKQPFEMRRVMAAVVDQDHPTLERWYAMRDAEIAVVWDAFLGGRPVAMIGFEAKNLPRAGLVPADGPEHWTSGTLFPMGSRKVAWAINAASGNRPLVVLANLSGFDGSPESMRTGQLEFGAEIGRAVVNFEGPIIFCVVSRYHGGAFVVFSGALNENLEVAAIQGSHASVIGGAPAAAVVFARDVRARVAADPRLRELEAMVDAADGPERFRLRSELTAHREQVHAEQLGAMAAEFDARHDIERAKRVGSVDTVIAPGRLRPYLIDAIERGIERAVR